MAIPMAKPAPVVVDVDWQASLDTTASLLFDIELLLQEHNIPPQDNRRVMFINLARSVMTIGRAYKDMDKPVNLVILQSHCVRYNAVIDSLWTLRESILEERPA